MVQNTTDATDIWNDLSLELSRLRAIRNVQDDELVFNDDLKRIMTTWITKSEFDYLKWEKGVKVKGGKFSKKEKEFLRNFVLEFLRQKDIDLSTFQYILREACIKESSFHGILRPIYKEASIGLHAGRSLGSVSDQIKRLFHPDNTPILWTDELDNRLLRLFDLYGPKWVTIGKSLGVYHAQCKEHYFVLQGKYDRGRWNEDDTIMLIAAVEELWRIRKTKRGAFWVVISDMLKCKRSPFQCSMRWRETIVYRLKNHGIPRVEWTLNDDYMLLTILYNLGVDDESEVKWDVIVHDQSNSLWNRTPNKIYHRWMLLKRRIPGYEYMNMDSILEALLVLLRPQIQRTLKENPEDFDDPNNE